MQPSHYQQITLRAQMVSRVLSSRDMVSADVRDFFFDGFLPRGYTSSFTALIPKSDSASKFSEFRPL